MVTSVTVRAYSAAVRNIDCPSSNTSRGSGPWACGGTASATCRSSSIHVSVPGTTNGCVMRGSVDSPNSRDETSTARAHPCAHG